MEKEGIPEVLARPAAKYGVALVNTNGRLTTDCIAFIEEIIRYPSSVCYMAVNSHQILSDSPQ
ncbi:MAG: hypothetical protein JO297_19685 [Nitrososphaeraceae archaeon]|nr:hypothetical protein [Nitrososphaeraceae archaeon]